MLHLHWRINGEAISISGQKPSAVQNWQSTSIITLASEWSSAIHTDCWLCSIILCLWKQSPSHQNSWHCRHHPLPLKTAVCASCHPLPLKTESFTPKQLTASCHPLPLKTESFTPKQPTLWTTLSTSQNSPSHQNSWLCFTPPSASEKSFTPKQLTLWTSPSTSQNSPWLLTPPSTSLNSHLHQNSRHCRQFPLLKRVSTFYKIQT